MDQNPFLKQFLNMRKGLHKAPEIVGKKPIKAVADPTGITMAHIIENKPSDKEVIEYFKARSEALNQD